MKIALELQPCLKNKSGVGVYTYELARHIQEYSDIELKGNIFNFMNRNNLTKDLQVLKFGKAYYTLFPYGIYRRIWHYLPISYNMLFKEQVDITHFFNFIVPPKVKGKVINTIHDLAFKRYPETMDNANLKRIEKDIDYSIERASKIVAVSEATKKDMIDLLGVPGDQIEVIYNGVDFNTFNQCHSKEEKLRVMKRYKLPEQYILYMGTLEPRKNIETIIRAYARFKKETDEEQQLIKLVLAGKKGWLYESIFKLVEELNLQDQVVFTDYLEERDKSIVYSMAEVFVFPSIYEGFGIPVIEAMASSVPVITSNISSLPEVAGDAGVLVNPKDEVRIAEGMHELITNTSIRKECIRKGLLQAQQFSWESSAEKLYNLYQTVYEGR